MISATTRTQIQSNFNPILFSSLLIGIFCPGLNRIPNTSVLVVMMAIIFLACVKVNRADLAVISFREAAAFYVIRFVFLPALLFYVASALVPTFAHGVLLLALMPAGVSSAALANLLGGSVSLALGVTVLSTALTPLLVPASFLLLADTSVEIDTVGMLGTLSLLVFVPIIADRLLDVTLPDKRLALREHSGWLSVILIALIVILIVGKYQNDFWQEPTIAMQSLVILSVEFAIFYLVGWCFVTRGARKKRISYAICSGANNCALAAAIAFLYLSPASGIYSVLSEIPWILALIPLKKYLGSLESRVGAEHDPY